MENKNIIAALLKAQTQIKVPVKEGVNPMFKSKYATLDAVYHACRDALSNNGLVLSHSVEHDASGFFLVTTLYHTSGESLSNRFPMIIEKQTNQGMASARTYACRYATANLLAMPSDEDDDGNSAEPKKPVKEYKQSFKNGETITEQQASYLHKKLKAYDDAQERMEKTLRAYNVQTITQLPRVKFPSFFQEVIS